MSCGDAAVSGSAAIVASRNDARHACGATISTDVSTGQGSRYLVRRNRDVGEPRGGEAIPDVLGELAIAQRTREMRS